MKGLSNYEIPWQCIFESLWWLGNFLSPLSVFPPIFPAFQVEQTKQSQRKRRICIGIGGNDKRARQKANKHPHMYCKQRWLTAENARNLSQHTKYVPKDFQFIFTKTIFPVFPRPRCQCIRRYCWCFCNRKHKETSEQKSMKWNRIEKRDQLQVPNEKSIATCASLISCLPQKGEKEGNRGLGRWENRQREGKTDPGSGRRHLSTATCEQLQFDC